MMQQGIYLGQLLWTLAIGTISSNDGVNRDELGAILVLGEDSAGVVSVGSKVDGSPPSDFFTISAKFSRSGCKSTLGPRCGAAILS